MQRVREAFAPLKPETPPDPLRLAEPEQRGERRSDLERPGPADLLSVGWHIPGAAHEDTPALVLLSTVLGGWRGFVPFAAGGWGAPAEPPLSGPPRPQPPAGAR